MKENLELWNKVEKTNPKHTKSVSGGGRKLTAINAQQQLKNATSEFGCYGKTWGLRDIKLSYVNQLTNNQIMAVAQAVFYYPEGDFEIGSSILVQSWVVSKTYNKVDDDFLKKLETDMMTKSLSKLGFNADVFLGYYDDNKYVSKMIQEFAHKPDYTRQESALKACSKIEELGKTYNAFSPTEKTAMTPLKDELKLKLTK